MSGERADGDGRATGGATPAERCRLGRVELPARDPARSARFYADAFGWRARAAEAEAPYYDLLIGDGDDTAGAGGRRDAGAGVTTPAALGSTHPLAVIHVDGDLAAVLERVVAGGGSVDLPPTEIAGHGTFARFRDPDGNLLGLWSATRRSSGPLPSSAR